jgi:osmotically-inducible protein OsmY
MKWILVLFLGGFLTACSTIGHNLAEITGLSFLHDRRSSQTIATDERIEDSAIIELHALDDVKERAHFNVTSYNGRVLITGEAETEAIREIIVANIRIISGVKLVYNEMVVAPLTSMASRSEDLLLTIRVKDALAEIKDKPGFDATRIKVITENKVVFLMGIVHEEEGMAAARMVQKVTGVQKIVTVFEYISYEKNKK